MAVIKGAMVDLAVNTRKSDPRSPPRLSPEGTPP
jgi:hypothetical protein